MTERTSPCAENFAFLKPITNEHSGAKRPTQVAQRTWVVKTPKVGVGQKELVQREAVT
jgi:hypothetical protein